MDFHDSILTLGFSAELNKQLLEVGRPALALGPPALGPRSLLFSRHGRSCISSNATKSARCSAK